MPTFPKGHSTAALNAKTAKMLAQLARETGGNLADERAKHVYMKDPVDLRGLPAVGRGCGGGAIRGTRPGTRLG